MQLQQVSLFFVILVLLREFLIVIFRTMTPESIVVVSSVVDFDFLRSFSVKSSKPFMEETKLFAASNDVKCLEFLTSHSDEI